MIEALEESVRMRGKPFLGICVGLQLMAERGLEHGVTPGLGWIKGEVRAIAPSDASLKIPHMGWNTLALRRKHALLEGIPTGESGLNAYFVHSYHLVPEWPDALVASTDYGGPITAFVTKDNLAGSQFHPEKSQKLGLASTSTPPASAIGISARRRLVHDENFAIEGIGYANKIAVRRRLLIDTMRKLITPHGVSFERPTA